MLRSKLLATTLLLFLVPFIGHAQCKKKFKPKKNTVALNPLADNEVNVGQLIYISLSEHGSTGLQSNADILNDGILKEVSSNIYYDNKRKSRMPGGDAGSRVYIYEVMKSGKTTITTEKLWRGEVKNTNSIAILVPPYDDEEADITEVETIEEQQPKPIENQQFDPKDMVKLTFTSLNEVEVGQAVYITVNEFASTGLLSSTYGYLEDILAPTGDHFYYNDLSQASADGGDKGFRVYTYRVVKPGRTKVKAVSLFRGDTTMSVAYSVKVIPQRTKTPEPMEDEKAFVLGENMIQLSILRPNTVAVGQLVYITLKEHASTGLGSKAVTLNRDILKPISSKFYYNNPDYDGMPGGDAGKRVYVFEVIEIGEAAIETAKVWRGVEEYKATVKVTAVTP